jgi:hypothetical protein
LPRLPMISAFNIVSKTSLLLCVHSFDVVLLLDPLPQRLAAV